MNVSIYLDQQNEVTTVKDLLERLQTLDPNAELWFYEAKTNHRTHLEMEVEAEQPRSRQ